MLHDGTLLCIGEWREHDDRLVMCDRGLHASTRAIDALCYAPGPIVCRVAVAGEIVRGDDKLVCSRRNPLWAFDATEVLRLFARECALGLYKSRVMARQQDLKAAKAFVAKLN